MISLLINVQDNANRTLTDITVMGASCPSGHTASEGKTVDEIINFIKGHSGTTVHKDLRWVKDSGPPQPGPGKPAKSDADTLWASFKRGGGK